jgi:hypothetical protein
MRPRSGRMRVEPFEEPHVLIGKTVLVLVGRATVGR